MKHFLLAICMMASTSFRAQPAKSEFLEETGKNACKCIDSVQTRDRRKNAVTADIGACIEKQVVAYQLARKLVAAAQESASGNKKDAKIEINTNSEAAEYKRYYNEIESYLMENCPAVKEKIESNELRNDKSVSTNKDAIHLYTLGQDAYKAGDFKAAIGYYRQAVKIDPDFAFAYDNMGLSYRQMNDYDNAIAAYEKSLAIDPEGVTPLQNMAVAYAYKKEFRKAIDTYKKLGALNAQDPEIFYGIGKIYAFDLGDLEQGLDNLCTAYVLYVQKKSPYRTDAEKLMQMIYAQMKQNGKEDAFDNILKAHNINSH